MFTVLDPGVYMNSFIYEWIHDISAANNTTIMHNNDNSHGWHL